MEDELIYRELSYQVIGLCFDVRNGMKKDSTKERYLDVLEKELQDNGLNYLRSQDVNFIIEDKLVLGLKNKNNLTDKDLSQAQKYIKGKNIELGIVINFRNHHITPKRVLNSNFKDNS